MKPVFRYLLCGLAGLALGAGAAAWSVRAGAFGSSARIGPWTTGGDIGTARASAYTRATVALHGLLALPAREARYYSADDDDRGRPLDGRCRYRISGGDAGGAWFSLTLYDPAGYLVANRAGLYSVGSAAMGPAERGAWTILAAPDPQPGRWLPTGGVERFNLTLRVYLPAGGGRGNLPRNRLPRIARLGCR
ncbi:MAG: hypothetical protein QOG72_3387 [Sphingomonadales bacterium]|jgi:hypothetical protein|nr:hypothetical protein [Sphingomonadales bacterium]